MLFTANPFGMFGTTGTFKLIEEASVVCDTYTFSREPMPGNTIYEAPETLSIELYDYLAKRHYPKIIEKVKAFNPCVLYILTTPNGLNSLRR